MTDRGSGGTGASYGAAACARAGVWGVGVGVSLFLNLGISNKWMARLSCKLWCDCSSRLNLNLNPLQLELEWPGHSGCQWHCDWSQRTRPTSDYPLCQCQCHCHWHCGSGITKYVLRVDFKLSESLSASVCASDLSRRRRRTTSNGPGTRV